MKTKSFKHWLTQELHEQFGLVRNFDISLLKDWLDSQEFITNQEKERLEELRLALSENAEYWNEEELKIKFIGQVVELVKISGDDFRTFYDRPISSVLNEIPLFGKVDMLVATGFQIPTKPFFCIHEYKQETKKDGDPKGQLLAEMLAVQTINADKKPIYGCYVVGRSWYFVVLKNTQYAVSSAYDATQVDDLFRIFQILRNIKTRIEQMLKT